MPIIKKYSSKTVDYIKKIVENTTVFNSSQQYIKQLKKAHWYKGFIIYNFLKTFRYVKLTLMKHNRIYCDHNATTPVLQSIQTKYIDFLNKFVILQGLYQVGREVKKHLNLFDSR